MASWAIKKGHSRSFVLGSLLTLCAHASAMPAKAKANGQRPIGGGGHALPRDRSNEAFEFTIYPRERVSEEAKQGERERGREVGSRGESRSVRSFVRLLGNHGTWASEEVDDTTTDQGREGASGAATFVASSFSFSQIRQSPRFPTGTDSSRIKNPIVGNAKSCSETLIIHHPYK